MPSQKRRQKYRGSPQEKDAAVSWDGRRVVIKDLGAGESRGLIGGWGKRGLCLWKSDSEGTDRLYDSMGQTSLGCRGLGMPVQDSHPWATRASLDISEQRNGRIKDIL